MIRRPSLVIGGPSSSLRQRSSVRSQTFNSAAASSCVRKSAKRFSVILICRHLLKYGDSEHPLRLGNIYRESRELIPAICRREKVSPFWGSCATAYAYT